MLVPAQGWIDGMKRSGRDSDSQPSHVARGQRRKNRSLEMVKTWKTGVSAARAEEWMFCEIWLLKSSWLPMLKMTGGQGKEDNSEKLFDYF